MPRYVQLGQVPRKRHTRFRKPDGGLYAEELFGTKGFSGISSLLYHITPPTQAQEFGAARPWVNVQFAEELVRGYLRNIWRQPPGQASVIPGKTAWFDEGAPLCGWLVRYVRGPSETERRFGRFRASELFEFVSFVQPEYGWVYSLGPLGAGPTLRLYDVDSVEGCLF